MGQVEAKCWGRVREAGLLEVRADEGLADTATLGLENQVTWEHSGIPYGDFLHQQACGSKTGKNIQLVFSLLLERNTHSTRAPQPGRSRVSLEL